MRENLSGLFSYFYINHQVDLRFNTVNLRSWPAQCETIYLLFYIFLLGQFLLSLILGSDKVLSDNKCKKNRKDIFLLLFPSALRSFLLSSCLGPYDWTSLQGLWLRAWLNEPTKCSGTNRWITHLSDKVTTGSGSYVFHMIDLEVLGLNAKVQC